MVDSDYNEVLVKRMKYGNGDFDYKVFNSKDDIILVLIEEVFFVFLLSEFFVESLVLLLKFCVICIRIGKSYSFLFFEVVVKFGGGINDWFRWRVDFSNLDIEVFFNIVDNSVVIGIVLIKEIRGKRNIVYFGLITLKLLIVYCMFLLVNI